MNAILLKKGGALRRILPDGKLQNWDASIGCWKGMKRKGEQFNQTAEEIARGFEASGWKRTEENRP